MVDYEGFKKALGKSANTLSETEIERLYIVMEKTAGAILNKWLKELKKADQQCEVAQ